MMRRMWIAETCLNTSITRHERKGPREVADCSWATFWSRPQADTEMPMDPCEANRCREAVGKGHFQLASQHEGGVKWTETMGGKKQSKAGNGHSTGKCWRTVESGIDDKKKRIGEMTDSNSLGAMDA